MYTYDISRMTLRDYAAFVRAVEAKDMPAFLAVVQKCTVDCDVWELPLSEMASVCNGFNRALSEYHDTLDSTPDATHLLERLFKRS